jgi:hypothetical protein
LIPFIQAFFEFVNFDFFFVVAIVAVVVIVCGAGWLAGLHRVEVASSSLHG